jgi:hypothetical protein
MHCFSFHAVYSAFAFIFTLHAVPVASQSTSGCERNCRRFVFRLCVAVIYVLQLTISNGVQCSESFDGKSALLLLFLSHPYFIDQASQMV